MNHKQPHSKIRSIIIIALAVVVFGSFIFQLIQIQIVDAKKYEEMVQGLTITTQPIKAARGEIVDRNGKPLVQNKNSYDVIFDLAFMPQGSTNETILKIIHIFEKNNGKWIDNLPISKTAPFAYAKGRDEEIAILKKEKNGQEYATAEDMMYWLIDEYSLKDYAVEDARKIAGVRYEMERRDFSLQIPYTFAKDVDSSLVIQIKERSFDLPGINVETTPIRTYPDDSIAPHVLGLVGPLYKEDYDKLAEEGLIFKEQQDLYDTKGYTMDDTIGKSGIEKSMEKELRGQNGLREIQLDAQGQVVAVEESISPIPGNTIRLTIDLDLQKNLQDYLEAQVLYLNENAPEGEGKEAKAAAGVVLNVKTGEVLAIGTYPSYTISDYLEDYTEVAERPNSPLINRAVLSYTPGSIYKPVVALTGLNKGVITRDSTYYCGHVYNRFAPSYTPRCLGSHGNINVINAIGWSCNIYFYETGFHVGIDAIDEMATQLGLGEYTGIEIEESKGQRSNPAVKEARGGGEWMEADTIQTAIGQFDSSYTPIQLANYAATIGNRGKRMKVTLIKEVDSYSLEEVIVPFEPKVAHEMKDVSPKAFAVTTEGMVAATMGSASGTFGGYPIKVASKTGTPQVSETVYNSTYIAFAPADDPEIAVAIVIEEGWQGFTSAPVAKAIFDDYFGIEHTAALQNGPQKLKQDRAKEKQKTEEKNEKKEDKSVTTTKEKDVETTSSIATPESVAIPPKQESSFPESETQVVSTSSSE